jgi:ferric-dicitrate binding protein FerR (iron transport regulator)
MDDTELINEVLELTLTCQQPDATAEERARLERLLTDNPAAIVWYLRTIDDTLTLRDATAAHEAATARAASVSSDVDGVAAELYEKAIVSHSASSRPRLTYRLAVAALACSVAVFAGMLWIVRPVNAPPRTSIATAGGTSARIVDVSNVSWSDGATQYREWSLIEPGDTLKFDSGLVNLFLSNGAEVLIEGPADVDFVSLQKLFARQGKLAARIGPGAVGFRIDTPHAKVIDRGTSFGVSVDGRSRTAVVVYEGIVDLGVRGDESHALRRLAKGEALSVDGAGHLSRITTVESSEFLEPLRMHAPAAPANRLIASVSDNIGSLETSKYYRVMAGGFREDCRAYVDRLHEWNGVDGRGLPPFLVGGDYVMTFNDDKIESEIEIAVTINQPANLFVLIDTRVAPPAWLKRGFVDTGWTVGCDEGWEDRIIDVSQGPGQSIEQVFSAWRRVVPEPTTVMLGALTDDEESPPPPVKIGRSMYGIVATPLSADRRANESIDWPMPTTSAVPGE